MAQYDRWLVPLDLKIRSTANLQHRAMLQVLRDHTAGEYERDLDRVLGTLVEEPEFHWYLPDGTRTIAGHDAIREFYLDFFAKQTGAHRDTTRLLVDDEAIWVEGPVQIVYSAAQLTAAGIPAPAGTAYLQHAQVGTVFPFRHGPDGPRIIGEDCYLPQPVMQPRSLDDLRLLTPDEMALHQ